MLQVLPQKLKQVGTIKAVLHLLVLFLLNHEQWKHSGRIVLISDHFIVTSNMQIKYILRMYISYSVSEWNLLLSRSCFQNFLCIILNIDLPVTSFHNMQNFLSVLQGCDSQMSMSEVSCSESTSSCQSLVHGSAPEILIGLLYNATTGRLSAEVIKGSHFKNLAANRPPSE